MTKNYLKLEFPAVAENIALARVAVAAFASQLDFTLPDIDDIRVAVSEAVTNVVVHAYPSGIDGTAKVFIETSLDGEVLEIRIADQGTGIADLEAARAAAGQGNDEHLGIGFNIMESCMDSLDVQSQSGRGTIVQMTKKAERVPHEGQN